ncbi:MAG: formylglycine-generating enzyme family protein, partial [Anaerolineae bacterium]|nr:formylglycine-generating enzyme family protein [Anaerolineae bacterium]
MLTNIGGKKEESSLQSQNESTASSHDTVSTAAMVRIPGGTFQMGSTEGESNEQPVHEVYVNDFYMGKYEVTVGDFRKFVNATGYRTEAEQGDGAYVWTGSSWEKKSDANWKNPYFAQSDDHPVVCVSWNDAVAYCNWLSGQENLTPCYSGSGNSTTCNFDANGYRLPT